MWSFGLNLQFSHLPRSFPLSPPKSANHPASKSNRPPRALCPSPWCGYYRNLPRLHLTAATHRHPSTLPPAIESFVTTMKVTRYTSFRCFLCLISCSLSPIVSRMLHTMSWVIGRQGCSFVAGWGLPILEWGENQLINSVWHRFVWNQHHHHRITNPLVSCGI